MRFNKKLVVAIVFAVIILFFSMFFKIIPCQTAPGVPNTESTWTLCNLNPDIATQSKTTYFGLFPTLLTAYLSVLAISFLLAMIILHFVARRKT